MKYNLGDKVRLLCDCFKDGQNIYKKGDVGIVDDYDLSVNRIFVKFKKGGYWWINSEDELELIETNLNFLRNIFCSLKEIKDIEVSVVDYDSKMVFDRTALRKVIFIDSFELREIMGMFVKYYVSKYLIVEYKIQNDGRVVVYYNFE